MYMKRQHVNNDSEPCKGDDNNKTQTLSAYKWYVDMSTTADC